MSGKITYSEMHLHSRHYLNEGDSFVVEIDDACNVLAMHDSDYSNYKKFGSFSYLGGWRDRSPATITVPTAGYWNLILDLAGGSGTLGHSITVVKGD